MSPDPASRACYLEDLAPGQRYAGGTAAVDVAGIKAFAATFDPQPFHLDEDAARTSIFGRLVASGWHTMALTMRMLVEGQLRSLWGLVGLGADELRWPRPVFPGDVPFARRSSLDIAGGDHLSLSSIAATVHLGAHADAPSLFARAA